MKIGSRTLIASVLAAGLIGALSACGGAEQGEQGKLGPDGQAGAPGHDSLVKTETIEPGDACPNGGVRINSGLDADDNGTLSADEIIAGSSTDVCSQGPPADDCGEALEIGEISGTDQAFVVTNPSAPLTAALNHTDGVELQLAGRGFTMTPGASVDEFSLTPKMAGGPFDLALVASDGCSVDVAPFRIQRVLTQNTMRTVWLFQPWADVELLETGETQPLVSAHLDQPTPPLIIDGGSHTFDIKYDGFVSTTTDPIDFPTGTQSTLVAYPLTPSASTSNDLGLLRLEDDMSAPGASARLRLINVDPLDDAVDVFALGSDQAIFSDAAFATPAAAKLVTGEDRIGLSIVDADGEDYDLMIDGPLFAAGTNANLFVYRRSSYDPPNVMVQYLDDAATSEVGERVLLAPIDFEDFSAPFYNLPYGVCTSQTPDGLPWSYTYDGSDHALAASARSQYPTTWLEIPVTAPKAGSFTFEWRSEGESGDTLLYCLDATATSQCTNAVAGCDLTTNDGALTGSNAWTSVTTPVLAPGTHVLRFQYAYRGSHVSDPNHIIRHRGWVDNITFTPESP